MERTSTGGIQAGAAPPRILLVDDDPVARRLAALLLQRLGCAPAATVSSGREALEAVRAGAYDLVLMDLETSGPDGREALRIMVETLGAPRPRIVVMTAAGDGHADHCSDAGADWCLAKPLGLQPLAEALAGIRQGTKPDDFNAEVWAELRRVFKPAGVAELIAAAVADLPQQRQRHAAAVEAGDMAALGRQFHALRGACLQFGAAALSQLCWQAEQACAAPDRAPALRAGSDVLERYAALLLRLEREARAG